MSHSGLRPEPGRLLPQQGQFHPVSRSIARAILSERNDTNTINRPQDGAIALYDDDLEIEELDFEMTHDTPTHEFTGAVSQFSQVVERPSYDLYYTRYGGETRFLSDIRTRFANATDAWRDIHVETESAKHNMKFGETAAMRREWRARFEMNYMYQEMARLRK